MGFTFIFLDGTGIGKSNKENPFFAASPSILKLWGKSEPGLDNLIIKSINSTLGIEGIPQSATSQTTIYTGINIPKLLGKHFGSFPNKKMRKIIKEENIFKKLIQIGKKPKFVNAYPMHSKIFSYPNIEISDSGTLLFSENFPRKYKKRISVTTAMIVSNLITPSNEKDIISGNSLYQDFTNLSLIKLGLKIHEISPGNAGKILNSISKNYDFSLYEYFQTDIYGHRKSFKEQIKLIRRLDRMIESLINNSDPKLDTILITSDHGNLEDSTTKSHTLNPVPLIVWGKGRKMLTNSIGTLTDITPAIIDFFK
jgi:hypothetical protein